MVNFIYHKEDSIKKMNKRGIESITAIIIVILGIVGAVFIGPQLFSIFVPPIGPTETRGLVNPVYYDAVDNPNFVCEVEQKIKFRATIVPDEAKRISHWKDNEIAIDEGGNSLVRYEQFTSSFVGSNAPIDCSFKLNLFGYSYGKWQAGTIKSGMHKGKYGLCTNTGPTGINTAIFKKGGSTVETSLTSVDSAREIHGDIEPIIEERFVCENGNVVLKQCADFGGSQLQQSCELGCSSISNYDIGGQFVDAVKCNGDFKPNRQLCIDNFLYKTDSGGNLLPATICEGTCTQIDEFTALCTECNTGEISCNGQEQLACINGNWQVQDMCPGQSSCQITGNLLGCTTFCTEEDLACSGDGMSIIKCSNQQWIDTGEKCDGGCNPDGSCKKVCEPGITCVSGALIECTGDGLDDEDLLSPIICDSSECLGSSCTPICNFGEASCFDEDVYSCIKDISNIKSGGVELALIKECNPHIGCDEATAECIKLDSCIGNEGDRICSGGNSWVCSSDGLGLVNKEVCNFGCDILAGTCNTQCTPNVDFCSGSNVHFCDAQGNDAGLKTTCEPLLGCTVIENVGICKTSEDCVPNTQGNACQGQFVMQCTEFGTFGTQAEDCGDLGCNVETGECNTECTQEQVSDFFCQPDGNSYICNTNLELTLDDTCTEGCDTSDGKCIKPEKICEQVNDRICLEDGNSYRCDSNLDTQLETECSELGCNENIGFCFSQCNALVGETCFDPREDLLGNSGDDGFGDIYECNAIPPEGGNEGLIDVFNVLEECDSTCTNNKCDLLCTPNSFHCFEDDYYSCSADGKSRSMIEDCQVDCVDVNNKLGCDSFEISLDEPNFAITEELVIEFNVERVLDKNIIVTGQGFESELINEAGTTVFTTTGNINNGVGRIDTNKEFLPGLYDLIISLTNTDIVLETQVGITTDVQINRITETVIFTTQTTPIQIEILENGKKSEIDGLTIDAQSENITVQASKSAQFGVWDLFVEGEPGQYVLLITPTRQGIDLSENTLPIELNIPFIKLEVDIPSSAKKINLDRDIEARGIENELLPLDNFEIRLTKPDGTTSTLSPIFLGSGRYNIKEELDDLGIYSFNFKAEKEGFETNEITKNIEITSSGNPSPGVTNTGSESTGTGGTESTEEEPTEKPPEKKDNTLLIIGFIIVVLIAGWYFFIKE